MENIPWNHPPNRRPLAESPEASGGSRAVIATSAMAIVARQRAGSWESKLCEIPGASSDDLVI